MEQAVNILAGRRGRSCALVVSRGWDWCRRRQCGVRAEYSSECPVMITRDMIDRPGVSESRNTEELGGLQGRGLRFDRHSGALVGPNRQLSADAEHSPPTAVHTAADTAHMSGEAKSHQVTCLGPFCSVVQVWRPLFF